jgi:hypothetical protein
MKKDEYMRASFLALAKPHLDLIAEVYKQSVSSWVVTGDKIEKKFTPEEQRILDCADQGIAMVHRYLNKEGEDAG